MAGKLKNLVRGSKGMEALQSVMLLGAGFVVVWGLMAIWNGKGGVEEQAKTQIAKTVGGEPGK